MKERDRVDFGSTRKMSGFWLFCLAIGLSTIFALSEAYAQTETDPLLINVLGSAPFSSKTVSLGYNHTCALTTTGGVKCWGINNKGQLGDGSFGTDRLTPVDVSGLSTGVQALAAGSSHSCALTDTGGVKCWGNNGDGQLGDGSSGTDRLTPVDVSGLTSGVQTLVAGEYHTCALTTSGGVKCWGNNGDGQLGDGSSGTDRLTPVDVSGLASGVQALAAGGHHTCALTTSGGVKCWGNNGDGQLGDGSSGTDRLTPVEVSGLASGVQTLGAGYNHTCALTTSGGVKCWGDNYLGQVGDGSSGTDRLTPVDVSGLASGVQALAVGYDHTCALADNGGVKCWGYNDRGQLGDGSVINRTIPVNVSGLTEAMAAVNSGEHHTCSVGIHGEIFCWGDNFYGQVGNGVPLKNPAPQPVSGLAESVEALAAGESHTCVKTSGGGMQCWGKNREGQLGIGSAVDQFTPQTVSGLAGGVDGIALGSNHSCAMTSGPPLKMKCWGHNEYGQIGDNTKTNRFTPVDVSGLPSPITNYFLDGGGTHTCATLAMNFTNNIFCWGLNQFGQLGDGTQSERLVPNAVSFPGWIWVTAIFAGGRHSCAINLAGAARCWGYNGFGQVGDGSSGIDRWSPVDVSGLSSGVKALAAGYDHTCALTTTGGVKCWGHNTSGQIGDNTTSPQLTPGDVYGLSGGVQALAAGYNHTCALTDTGGVKCWGANYYGQLGDGTSGTNRLTPVDVIGLTSGVAALAAGGDHTCALTTSGGVKCWGYNDFGQIGNGWSRYYTQPVKVVDSLAIWNIYLPLIIK